MMFEVRASPEISASALARRMGVDRGRISRILSRLRKLELVERQGSPGGRRALPLRLTERGREVLEELEVRSDHQAGGLLGALDAKRQARLTAVLLEAQTLLQEAEGRSAPGGSSGVRLREAGLGDLGRVVSRHAEIYSLEYGFTQEFEGYVLSGLAEYMERPRDGSRVWIAEQGGVWAGCVGAVEQPGSEAQLRWLLVAPALRGSGAGRLLVKQAVSFCRGRNYRQIFLWTLQDLSAARSLYQSVGFALAESRQGVMGGRSMVEERWVLDLAPPEAERPQGRPQLA
jgi:DNA-binding MarR family transcriptional regulator/GNAT superfamily N-acetyltransferase